MKIIDITIASNHKSGVLIDEHYKGHLIAQGLTRETTYIGTTTTNATVIMTGDGDLFYLTPECTLATNLEHLKEALFLPKTTKD